MKKIIVAILASLLLTVTSAQAETVYLSVAASMTDAFKELIADFTAEHPEAKIFPNFGSSGSMAKQIDQGAPADLFVSANPKWMKFLVEKKLVAPGTDHTFAYNRLVFVGQEKTGVGSLADLVKLARIAIGTPESVPAGQYARQALEGAGLYAALEQEKKLVMAKDVRQALLYADRGEADGAFVYKTDALLAQNAIILFTVPDELYDRVAYPLALTAAGAKNPTAVAFYDYMAGEKAVAILAKYGFEQVK